MSDSKKTRGVRRGGAPFEQKYNFRFEEPDGGVIQSHARTIEGTVRKEKTSRRDARLARNERKLSEKERLRAEVRRLKNLKREEIRDEDVADRRASAAWPAPRRSRRRT